MNLLSGVPCVVPVRLLRWLIDLPLRRRVRTRSRVYWPVSALGALTPSLTFMSALPA
ncbi:hypothetical protein [Streptomyces sp. NPDC005955]|uniref:hypothetical protein n=1 Tax=Streptomyces sp. NPDC005955 TaxID=3364738 RepID=UPI003697778F